MERQRLRESFTISLENVEKVHISESVSKELTESFGEAPKGAYKFPIWRLDERNLNGRTYPKKLGESIVKNGAITSGLMDHPKGDEPGNPKDIWAVEKNPSIKDGVLYAEFYLVGEHGKKAKEILEYGGKIGLSSSAFGVVGDDGNVLVEDFELERYADWVENPSYQVYGKQEHAIPQKQESVEKKEEKKIEEKIENKSEDMNMKVLSKFEVKQLKESIARAISIDNPTEKLTELEEINSWFAEIEESSITGIKPSVQEAIESTKKEIAEIVKEAKAKKTKEEDEEKEPSEEEKGETEDEEKMEEAEGDEEDKKEDDKEEEKEPEKTEEACKKKEEEGDSEEEDKEDKEDEDKEEMKEAEGDGEASEEEKDDEEKEEVKESSYKAKFEELTALTEKLKKYAIKNKKMYEIQVAKTNSMVTATEYVELYEAHENLKKKYNSLVKKVKEGAFIKESTPAIKSKPEVRKYYEDMVKTHPYLVEIKEEILAAEGIGQAVRIYQKEKATAKSLYERRVSRQEKVSESVKNDVKGTNETGVTGAQIPKGWV